MQSVAAHRQRTFVGTVTKWVKYGSTTVYELDGNIDYWQVTALRGSGAAGVRRAQRVRVQRYL
jgi:hypothetical protein